jgi:hypothetical protein
VSDGHSGNVCAHRESGYRRSQSILAGDSFDLMNAHDLFEMNWPDIFLILNAAATWAMLGLTCLSKASTTRFDRYGRPVIWAVRGVLIAVMIAERFWRLACANPNGMCD